jgi:hypothetical protein
MVNICNFSVIEIHLKSVILLFTTCHWMAQASAKILVVFLRENRLHVFSRPPQCPSMTFAQMIETSMVLWYFLCKPCFLECRIRPLLEDLPVEIAVHRAVEPTGTPSLSPNLKKRSFHYSILLDPTASDVYFEVPFPSVFKLP